MINTTFSERITLSTSECEHLVQAGFGTVEKTKLRLTLPEAYYLLEAGKLNVLDGRKKSLNAEQFERKAAKLQPNFWIRAKAYSDLRARGYVVRSGLKFGAEFTVYERGTKIGEEHAKWLVFPVHESSKFTWQDFSAKNRVAHSTKKRLVLAIVDDEGRVTYFEVRWVRP